MSTTGRETDADRRLARVVRQDAARIVARLHRLIGDFDVAEEAVADAVVESLAAWRRDGPPRDPAAWLSTVARNNALDRVRRDARYRSKLGVVAARPAGEPTSSERPDDWLGVLFGCCHPAIGRDAQVALTLRAVVGLTTAEIARATLSAEATIAQRIVRAKRKITGAGIPVRVPAADELRERLDIVLLVIYLAANEAHLATSGAAPARADLADDAVWLTRLVVGAFPLEAEPLGLLALLRLQQARDPARFQDGRLVLLRDQDRSRWDRSAIADAEGLLEQASWLRRPGRYQLQAAIAACHAAAPTWRDTDWLQILTLYDVLAQHDRSPVVRLNQAVARSYVDGPEIALGDVDELQVALGGYHLFHAVRGDLLRRLGRPADAELADRRALSLTGNPAERELLAGRLGEDIGPT